MNALYHFLSRRLITKFFVAFFSVFLATAAIAIFFLIRSDTAHEQDKLAARVGNQAARAANALRNHRLDEKALQDNGARRLAQDLLAPLNAESAVECVGLEVGTSEPGTAQPDTIPNTLSCGRYTGKTALYQVTWPVEGSDLRLVVYFNEDPIADEAKMRSQLVILVMGTAILLSILSATAGYKLVVGKRLQKLRRTMLRASEGGARHAIPPGPPDEIGMLLTGYNELIRSETAREEELQQAFRKQARIQDALKQANTELETWIRTSQSEQRFKDFASSSSDYFWELDSELKFSFLSERFTELTGLPAQEYLGASAIEKGLPNSPSEAQHKYLQALASRDAFRDVDFQVALSGNTAKWISIAGAPAYDDAENFIGYRGTGSDITERMSMLNRLHRSERMDALGQLTGGIAHDFNNLLGIIRGHAELIEMTEFESPAKAVGASVREIVEASDRGAALVKQLLAFGGNAESSPSSLDVAAALHGMFALLESAVGDAVELRIRIEQPLWPAYCDATQFDSAILNLVITARDATATGGTVTISSKNRYVTKDAGSSELSPGRYVCVEVSDTGSGIAPDDLPRIFEPFFTTKRPEGGSGLGLSVVHGFAEQSGGHAVATSQAGEGTTISLYLPRSGDLPDEHSNVRSSPNVRDWSGRQILVVEDNRALREVTVAYLQKAGFDTIEAGTGRAALDTLEANPTIALVLTDIALPGGMSGTDLVNQIAISCPGLPVVPTSGHARHPESEGLVLPILPKPYTYAELIGRIEDTFKNS